MPGKARNRRHPRGKTAVKTAEESVIRVRLETGPNWTGWLSLALALAGLLSQWFGR